MCRDEQRETLSLISAMKRVSVIVVTYNDADHVAGVLQSVFDQTYPNIEMIAIDNASTDSSAIELQKYSDRVRVILNETNLGFAAAQNQGMRGSSGDWVLSLNPDARLHRDCIAELVHAGEASQEVGSVSPKIYRWAEGRSFESCKQLDSAGMYFTTSLRHFDRGSQDEDGPSYSFPCYVMGCTGAAGFYRRAMIEDVSCQDQFFDEDFFCYREDADVVWRSQLLGWKCLFAPRAIAYHIRTVFHTNRASLSSAINMHSTKNRFLMRIKNVTPAVYSKVLIATTLRDALVIAYVVLKEHSSLAGLRFVVLNWKRFLQKRRWIQSKIRVEPSYIAFWFAKTPATIPLSPEAAKHLEACCAQSAFVSTECH